MNLKGYRLNNGLTQCELANIIGVSASSISKYEKGHLKDNAVKLLIDSFLNNNSNVKAFNNNGELEVIQLKYIDLLANELLNAVDLTSKKVFVEKLNKIIEV